MVNFECYLLGRYVKLSYFFYKFQSSFRDFASFSCVLAVLQGNTSYLCSIRMPELLCMVEPFNVSMHYELLFPFHPP